MKFKINFISKNGTILVNKILILVLIVSLAFGISGQMFTNAIKNPISTMTPGGTPNCFCDIPNYANSPFPELDAAGIVIPGTGIRKFVDSLPGLGATMQMI